MSVEAQGRKEVLEAVAIAALNAAAVGIINWLLETAKEKQKKRAAAKESVGAGQ